MSSLSIDLDVRVLERLGDLTSQAMGEQLQALADEIVADAKTRCPVSPDGSHGNPPGFLRDSIHAAPEADGTITVVADASYAIFQELGTRYQPGQAFLVPAVDAAEGRLPDLVREGLERAVREAGG